jgi:hypothetical protein
MCADGEQPLGDGEIAIAQRPLDHRLMGEDRLQLAPDAIPSSSVPDWLRRGMPQRQRRIHMEMRIDEGGRDEIAPRIDHLARLGR